MEEHKNCCEMNDKCCKEPGEECRHKSMPRTTEQIHALQNRLNRIIGQLNGVKRMLDDNRYCCDILLQVAAAERAMQNLGYEILKEHMKTCMAEDIKAGNMETIDEAFAMLKMMK